MRIYLIGYMYSGKTTIGKKLANALHYSFLDLDLLFEKTYKITIPLFFQKYDESLFRNLESKILHSTLKWDNTIIATGGGTPCYNNNMEFINTYGISVYLDISEDLLTTRMENSKHPRPLLSNIPMDKRNEFISNQLLERQKYYRQAHLTYKQEEQSIEDLKSIIENLNNSMNIQ